jgi:hypothetical protein
VGAPGFSISAASGFPGLQEKQSVNLYTKKSFYLKRFDDLDDSIYQREHSK